MAATRRSGSASPGLAATTAIPSRAGRWSIDGAADSTSSGGAAAGEDGGDPISEGGRGGGGGGAGAGAAARVGAATFSMASAAVAGAASDCDGCCAGAAPASSGKAWSASGGGGGVLTARSAVKAFLPCAAAGGAAGGGRVATYRSVLERSRAWPSGAVFFSTGSDDAALRAATSPSTATAGAGGSPTTPGAVAFPPAEAAGPVSALSLADSSCAFGAGSWRCCQARLAASTRLAATAKAPDPTKPAARPALGARCGSFGRRHSLARLAQHGFVQRRRRRRTRQLAVQPGKLAFVVVDGMLMVAHGVISSRMRFMA